MLELNWKRWFFFAGAPSSGIDSAIVGGSLAEPHEFPYVASFQRRGLFGFIHSCGAVIYNQRWVLVAAQCVDKFVDFVSSHSVSLKQC